MVVFVVIAHACSVVTRDGVTGSARQLSSWLVQQLLHMTCGVRVKTALFFFFFACKFLFVCFVVYPMFVAGDLGHEFSWSAWGFLRRVSSSCIHRACIVAIDAPVTVIVVAGWVSLWYSQGPLGTLVAFVGKAALWLWGRLPRLSLSCLRGLSCEHFGASWLWRWLHQLQLVMALIASIAVGHVVVNCCHLLQMCLALMLTLCSQLRFLPVY